MIGWLTVLTALAKDPGSVPNPQESSETSVNLVSEDLTPSSGHTGPA